MKSIRISREGALKGLLLMALVANISWRPLAEQISQMDFASNNGADPTATAQTPGARTGCAGTPGCQPATPQQLAEINRNSQEARRRAEAAGAPAGAAENPREGGAGAQTPPTGGAPAISPREGTVTPDATATADQGAPAAAAPGESNGQATAACPECLAQASRDAQIQSLEEQIAALRSTTEAARGRTPRTQPAPAPRPRPTAEQIAACEIGSNGEELTEVQELSCQVRRLSTLRGRDSADERRSITSRIEELFNALKRSAREDLLSDESDARRRGERSVANMLAVLSRARFDRDSVREDMIQSLRGLQAGARVRAAAEDLQDDVRTLNTEMTRSQREYTRLSSRFQNSCRSQQGCDRETYEELREAHESLQELRSEHSELAATIRDEREESFESLSENRDGITRAELREYMSPYTRMNQTMERMLNPNRNSRSSSTVGSNDRFDGSGSGFDSSSLPADFYDVRNGANAMRRSNGMYTPNTQVPMGSQGNINQQQQMGQYNPYMQFGGTNGLGQPPVPGAIPATGMANGGYQPYMPMNNQYGMNQYQMGQPPVPGAIPAGYQQQPGMYQQPGGVAPGGSLLPPPNGYRTMM